MTAPDPFAALPEAALATVTGEENLLILALQPGDESLDCGGLIAEACRRGRPPFVMVLHDGSASHPGSRAFPPERIAALRERETREAVHRLGLRPERLLMAGLFDGPTPEEGPVFEAIIRAVRLVMWARDCNLILAPWPEGAAGRAAHRIASEVAAGSGVGHIAYAGARAVAPGAAREGWRLGIAAHQPAKRAAIAAHATQGGGVVTDDPAPRISPARLAAAERPFEALLRPPA
ncbi:N-acetylglucosaminyl deacetylase, LmbE family [Roseomonas rosea]|uniref:N-acetylglucosaminyl deacetylase, LmbE family n=1 Tax=Muricoccus roseus TaxID=198092 RepID=A0A1M6A9P2_9PROT|nr:PIG-L family deacetylase [Roseomonas rosea]SHI33178.1 N-acetylglucosaminyl deacetylase, LmbE family [Roseomonas rosea]